MISSSPSCIAARSGDGAKSTPERGTEASNVSGSCIVPVMSEQALPPTRALHACQPELASTGPRLGCIHAPYTTDPRGDGTSFPLADQVQPLFAHSHHLGTAIVLAAKSRGFIPR